MRGRRVLWFGRFGIGVVVAGLVAVMLSGAGTAAPAGRLTGAPIKFGFIDSLAGSTGAQPQFHEAIELYFNDWNERGGYKGHPVQLVYDGPGFNPGANQAAVLRQANTEKVVAFLNAGFCPVNLPTLTQLKILTFGGDPNCYDKSFMASFGGSQATTLPMFKWASDNGAKNFAMVYPDLPGFEEGFFDPLQTYVDNHPRLTTKLTGLLLPFPPSGADIDGAIAELRSRGVDSMFFAGTPETLVIAIEHANQNNYGPSDGIKWVNGPNFYTPEIAELPLFEGTYALSQFYPWEDTKNPAVKRMIKVVGKKIPDHNGFAASGYQTAASVEAGMKKLKGPVTVDSVREAFLAQHKFQMPLAPYKADLGDLTNVPSGGQILESKNGKWVTAGDFIVVAHKEFET